MAVHTSPNDDRKNNSCRAAASRVRKDGYNILCHMQLGHVFRHHRTVEEQHATMTRCNRSYLFDHCPTSVSYFCKPSIGRSETLIQVAMKFSLLLLSLTSTVSAFNLAPVESVSKTALSAASTGNNFNKRPNDWTGYALSEKTSTTPVSARKVSPFQRTMMADVMIEPNYFLTWAVAALCPLIIWYHPCKSN